MSVYLASKVSARRPRSSGGYRQLSPAKITFSGNDHELIFEAESVETAGCCIVQSRGAYAGWVLESRAGEFSRVVSFMPSRHKKKKNYAISGIKKK